MSLDDLKHAQRTRLLFLDRCFTWRGIANRRDLMERFNISNAQAALDFKLYLDLAVDSAPVYVPARKTYVAASAHRPLLASSLTEAFDILVDESQEAASFILPRPDRKADPRIISILHQAVKAQRAIHIRYTSMSSGVDEGQWIAPTRFTSDGENVHLRAYSFKHRAHRHYLPIRIDPDSSFDTRSITEALPDDEDWNTRAIIWLRPKLGLSERQAAVVRREYGFEGAFLQIETRKAMEFFFDRRWGLDGQGSRLERAKTEYIRFFDGGA